MGESSAIKGLNNFIGGTWAFIGSLVVVGSLLWLFSALFSDAIQTLVIGLPIPNDPFDFVIIFSLLFVGAFFVAWGIAMLQRREWGALAGGMARLVLTMYLLAGALIFHQSSSYWLVESAMGFYNRYAWLVWALFGLGILWLFATTWFLLLGRSRRDYYAEAYQSLPAPAYQTCAQCGLILDDGHCPEHDRRTQTAYLRIGDRRETLPFTEEDTAFIVGRQKDRSEAYITISREDTQHPERISGRHLLIQYHFDYGQFTIQDLASLNKTYLNDDPEPLPPNQPYPLKHGDKISLAREIDLTFEYVDNPT